MIKFWINGLLVVIIVALLAFIMSVPEAKHRVKQAIIITDYQLFDGFFYDIWHERPRIDLDSVKVNQLPPKAYAWLKENYFYTIAHRLGPSFHTGENRIATFNKALAQGFRFFEVDLMLTSDRQLICYHGHSHEEVISYQNYVDASAEEGYEPCVLDDLIQLALAHPEIYFILDVKNDFEGAYTLIKEKVRSAGVGYSFIPQIYFIEQSDFVRREQVFSAEIYTAYRSSSPNQRIFEQARVRGIPVVTLSTERLQDKQQPLPKDLFIFTHPVNDFKQAMAYKQQGIAGIYTSYLPPEMFIDTGQ